jgi:hypothetical protein
MDIKGLYQAIKELRAELERVNLAIQRIEAIAAAIALEQEAGNDPSEPKPQTDKPTRDEG